MDQNIISGMNQLYSQLKTLTEDYNSFKQEMKEYMEQTNKILLQLQTSSQFNNKFKETSILQARMQAIGEGVSGEKDQYKQLQANSTAYQTFMQQDKYRDKYAQLLKMYEQKK